MRGCMSGRSSKPANGCTNGRTSGGRAATGGLVALVAALVLAGCAVNRPAPPRQGVEWAQRETLLQQASAWALDGRTAVAVGTQGWQATLDWRQANGVSEVHLSGPFGAGAMLIKLGPDGVSVNGAPPAANEQAQLEAKLGFAPPLAELRYWLLGVPAPGEPVEHLERNALDRAVALDQAGWSVHYERYEGVGEDSLPALIRLERDTVRVRVAVDRWEAPR